MPYDHPEPDDPQVLVGVALPADEAATRDMAYAFAEEFARMGYGAERLLQLFRNPYYAAAHAAYRTLGAAAVRGIVAECVGCWGGVRAVDRAPGAGASGPPELRACQGAAPAREEG
jgi:hypothetical protein